MKHVHFIGIGGTGLSAIALVLAERGYTVTGSDQALSPLAESLAEAGIQVSIGHAAAHIHGADVVVRSSAVPNNNPEVAAALQDGIPVLKRSEFMGEILKDHYGIAVAGTNGKTTTTAMTAWTLFRLGLDPSFICGGVLNNLGTNARSGRGEHFVVEADEYDHMFLGLNPQAAIITNIEYDHPDCFPTRESYQEEFRKFIYTLPEGGLLIAFAPDPGVQKLLAAGLPAGVKVGTYGPAGSGSDYEAGGLRTNPEDGYTFNFLHNGQNLSEVTLKIPGEHNVNNACAVLALAAETGLSVQLASGALREYSGAGRRFEVCGEAGGVTLIDDYAHHPTAILATLSAARARYPGRRIWALWQPHTYSRTRRLFDGFTKAFAGADRVIVTEIYAAREAPQNFSSASLVQAMNHPAVHFIPTLAGARDYLKNNLQPGDVLLVLSAGDANRICTELLADRMER